MRALASQQIYTRNTRNNDYSPSKKVENGKNNTSNDGLFSLFKRTDNDDDWLSVDDAADRHREWVGPGIFVFVYWLHMCSIGHRPAADFWPCIPLLHATHRVFFIFRYSKSYKRNKMGEKKIAATTRQQPANTLQE